MINNFSATLLSLVVCLIFSPIFSSSVSFAQNKIYIDVGKANIKKSLVALPPFQYFGADTQKAHLAAGQETFSTVLNDLTVASLFTFIQQDAFLEDTSKVGLLPAPGAANGFDFNKWKTIGTEFLVRAGYNVVGSTIKLEAYLYYVPQAKVIFGKKYEAPISAARKLGHIFASDMVEKLTGKKAMFNSKLAVSSTRGAGDFKEIFIMDWDGKNVEKISSHKSIAISPAWSNDGKNIAYTAFAYHPKSKTRNADLFIYDLEKKKRWLVSYRKGINSGACYIPNSDDLLLTVSQSGSPDIFRMNKDGSNLRRITNGPGGSMNVEPAVTSDGKTVAFSSDRSGRPMIYTMGIDGSSVKRVTFAGKYNASPSWSPDGEKIVFAGYDKSHFDIFIMNKNGTNLQRLTSAKKTNGKNANNEDPTFSPDGRHIAFISDRTGKKQIYIINVDGTNERRITVDSNDYGKPKWSPILE